MDDDRGSASTLRQAFGAPGWREAYQLSEAETLAGFGRWTMSASGFEVSAGLLALAGVATLSSGRAAFRLLPREQRPALVAAVRQGLGGSTPDPVDFILLCPGAGTRTLRITVRREPVSGSLWGLCQDVSAVASVSVALQQSENRWAAALETAGQGIWDVNRRTGQVYHSRTWRKLRGLSEADDRPGDGPRWLTHGHPDDIERLTAYVTGNWSVEHSGPPIEYRERREDGSYVWIHSVGAAVEWFDDGRPSRVIGADTDITSRKLAEERLVHLSRRLELALQVSQIGVFEANLTTGELFWDARVRAIYGVDPDRPIGQRDWEDALHPDDAERAQAKVGGAVASCSSYTSEFRIIRPDGEVRHIRNAGTWYRDALGVPRILGANWDVTEEVTARTEMERAMRLAEARNLELEAAKARIEHNALHDALTRLANRRYLDKVLTERASAGRVGGRGVALLHIDLDRFKQINDTLGHQAGDAMLVHVAELLRANVEPGDFVARVGGDEFVIVCDCADNRDRLEHLAGRIIAEIRRPVPYRGHTCRFGASIGIAIGRGTAIDPERLLMDADIALYLAKARGKNGFQFFNEALQQDAVSARQLSDDVLTAIEADQFLPFYQPLFDARTQALAGVEALARWQHPTRGLLGPGEFLKIAEGLNVVTTIDGVILKQAAADFNRWAAMGLDIPALSVNVSFRRLGDKSLIDSLQHLGIGRGKLSFELLESIFLDDVDDTVSGNLDRIRELGIELSIDDFGTGHASILSLLKLRPTRLKIDRQFLDAIEGSAAQQRLVGSLIDIGKSLGIKVVAEGIETRRQADILRDLGCDLLQGFFFARPMSAAALEAQLGELQARRAS